MGEGGFLMNVKTEFALEKYKEVLPAVPQKKLSDKQKKLVERVFSDKNDFSESEMDTLAGIIKKYGKTVKDINASELIKNQESIIDTIQTEHALLDLLEKEQKDQYLTVDIPLKDGKHRVNFKVLPISDSRALTSLEAHTNLFNDFTIKEKDIFNRGQQSNLSEDELDVYNHLLDRLNDNALSNSETMIIELLSHQLQIGNTLDVETNRRIWERMPFNVKMAVFIRVEEMLGLKDFQTEELFPITE